MQILLKVRPAHVNFKSMKQKSGSNNACMPTLSSCNAAVPIMPVKAVVTRKAHWKERASLTMAQTEPRNTKRRTYAHELLLLNGYA